MDILHAILLVGHFVGLPLGILWVTLRKVKF